MHKVISMEQEQCPIKDKLSGQYLKCKNAEDAFNVQVSLSKHFAECQHPSCIESLNARVGVELQTRDGKYLKDIEYLQSEFQDEDDE